MTKQSFFQSCYLCSAALLALSFAGGCGGNESDSKKGGSAKQPDSKKDLGLLILMYSEYDTNNNRGPAAPADLKPEDDRFRAALERLKEGRYVLIWKVPLQKRAEEGN